MLGQFAKLRHVGHRRVVAVASALSGEGKTFSSFHLALSLALERDPAAVREALAGCDTVVRPSVVFGPWHYANVYAPLDVVLVHAIGRLRRTTRWGGARSLRRCRPAQTRRGTRAGESTPGNAVVIAGGLTENPRVSRHRRVPCKSRCSI